MSEKIQINRVFYICQRNNQCPQKCGEDCRYTNDFWKSKLYHETVKPINHIKFLLDKNNNIWEVDMNWKYNLPVMFRKIPETMVAYDYKVLENWEVEKKWNTLNRISRMRKLEK